MPVRVRFDDCFRYTPYCVVAVTLKPRTVIQFLFATVKAWASPETVTDAPGAGWYTIGAEAVPEFFGVTFSEYVPAATWTVCPATATFAAAPIEQYGTLWVPDPTFEQLGLFLSTNSVAATAE